MKQLLGGNCATSWRLIAAVWGLLPLKLGEWRNSRMCLASAVRWRILERPKQNTTSRLLLRMCLNDKICKLFTAKTPLEPTADSKENKYANIAL